MLSSTAAKPRRKSARPVDRTYAVIVVKRCEVLDVDSTLDEAAELAVAYNEAYKRSGESKRVLVVPMADLPPAE